MTIPYYMETWEFRPQHISKKSAKNTIYQQASLEEIQPPPPEI